MEPIKKIPLLPLVAYFMYVIFWGAGRYLSAQLEDFSAVLATIVFYLVGIIPFGVIVALKVANKVGYKLHQPRNGEELRIGVLILTLIILLGVFSTDVYETITEDPAVVLDLLRSSLLVLPFGLGVSLNILFLVPRAIQTHLTHGFVSVVVTALSIGLAMGIGWLFDSMFANFDAAMIMLVFGILFGFGAALTRSFYINFAAFSIILLINTLNMDGLFEEPFLGTLFGFILTCGILLLSAAKRNGYL